MNAALVSQGLDEAVSETDTTDEFNLLTRNWPTIVESELEEGLYNFTREEATLASRSDGLFGYPDSYLVPGDSIHVRRLWGEAADGTRIETYHWTQDGTRVHVDKNDGVTIEYIKVSDPSVWSAAFAKGIQYKLEAVIRRAVWEEMSEARFLDQMAKEEFERARVISSRSRSAQEPFKESRFSKARFLRG